MRIGLVLLPALPLILIRAEPLQAQNYPWCAAYASDATSNCGFTGIEQCQAALGGNGGVCVPNGLYRPVVETPAALQSPAPSTRSTMAATKSTIAAKKPAAVTAKTSRIAANSRKPQSVKLARSANMAVRGGKYTVAGRSAPVPSGRPNDKGDPVTEKAKASIAALMEKPASAAFGQIKRATKDLLGESLDTICGYVKGKNASGQDTGEMPFLYIVHENEAYLVDGKSMVAETVHGVLCN